PFLPSPRPQVERFRQVLLDKGVHASIRESRGQDVQAACGQLAARPAGWDLAQFQALESALATP
ncbi:MAG: hypothetical protein K6U89_11545, partial [Chloroflexi bacterium]|nr:hypothetical protein [Chloroflexota bacterium]